MRKFRFLAVAMLVALVCPAMAQEGMEVDSVVYSKNKFKVETNGFWSNWFVSAGVGAQVFLGDNDSQRNFGGRISPAVDLAIGKWFTPGFGLRLAYNGLNAKGATNSGINTNGNHVGDAPVNGEWMTEQKFNFANTHVDMMFNFSNLFCGFNEKRVWNSTPYIGFGWTRVWGDFIDNDFSTNIGWLNSFRVAKGWDLNLDVHGFFTRDRIDGERGGVGRDAAIAVTVGATYKMKKRGWEKAKTLICYNRRDVDAMRDELNAMRANYNELEADNARLKEENAKKVPENHLISDLFVKFDMGKAELSDEARVNIGMFANAVKAGDEDAVYTITGYADNRTGGKDVNMRLSQERAEAIYNCLVDEYGVDKDMLKVEYKGGVDNMFYDNPALNRAAIGKRTDK